MSERTHVDDPTTAEQLAGLPAALMRYAEALRDRSARDGVRSTLQLAVDLAGELLDGCDAADVMFVDDDEVTTPVMSSPLAGELDRLQADCGEGPCLQVATSGLDVVQVDDLASDGRWPTFGPRAAELGVRSAVSYRIDRPEGPAFSLGSLNLYSYRSAAFDPVAVAVGSVISAQCQWTLAVETEFDGLQHAVGSRDLIGQAKGILMERHGVSADEAFSHLRKVSQDRNTKLREVARQVIEGARDLSGSDPSGPVRASS